MTTQQIELSAAEKVFVQRMLPHFLAGKSAVQAAAAVLEDDQRLLSAVAFVPAVDNRKPDFRVVGLRQELIERVYRGCRSAA